MNTHIFRRYHSLECIPCLESFLSYTKKRQLEL